MTFPTKNWLVLNFEAVSQKILSKTYPKNSYSYSRIIDILHTPKRYCLQLSYFVVWFSPRFIPKIWWFSQKKQSSLRYPKIKIGFHPLKNVRYPKIWLVSSFNRKIHHFPMVGTRLDGFHRLFRLSGDGACSYQSSLGFGWSLAEVRSDTNLPPKKLGWTRHDVFFCHQFKFAWIWCMIWWIWQIMTNLLQMFQKVAFYFGPDFGMVVKSVDSVRNFLVLLFFLRVCTRWWFTFWLVWPFLMRASGDSPFLRWDNLDKMMVFAAWVIT